MKTEAAIHRSERWRVRGSRSKDPAPDPVTIEPAINVYDEAMATETGL
jgi:hypothetical protein